MAKVVPKASPEPEDADRSSALLGFLQAYGRHAIEDLNALLKAKGLSLPQWGALQLLRAKGPCSVSAIARHLGLSATATSHLVDRLVRMSLVDRSEDAADRRQKNVTLTDPGNALLKEADLRSAAGLESLLAPVPPEERAALEAAMAVAMRHVLG